MQLNDFFYELPDELIAQSPAANRSDCRLLSLEGKSGIVKHGLFPDLLRQLNSGDLLVLNNTQVIPARLNGHKLSGGKIEVFVERILGEQQVLAHLRSSNPMRAGGAMVLTDLQGENRTSVTVIERQGELFKLQFDDQRPILDILRAIGQVPLPPYINRPETSYDHSYDQEQYQTLYASVPGAVAAPTAGLHFDQNLLTAIEERGVKLEYLTLHVGAGTFQPVRSREIHDHVMHGEQLTVPAAVRRAVRECRANGNKVVAVGTTVVRALESAAQARQGDRDEDFNGETHIFIYPGFQFQSVDALITNFHLPKSTLLMLVCAFAGHRETMQAYQEAIQHRYRFFSYGDAMFVTPNYRSCATVVA